MHRGECQHCFETKMLCPGLSICGECKRQQDVVKIERNAFIDGYFTQRVRAGERLATYGFVKRNRKVRLPGSFLVIPLYFGQINVKWVENSLWSERNGNVLTFVILGVRFTWRSAFR